MASNNDGQKRFSGTTLALAMVASMTIPFFISEFYNTRGIILGLPHNPGTPGTPDTPDTPESAHSNSFVRKRYTFEQMSSVFRLVPTMSDRRQIDEQYFHQYDNMTQAMADHEALTGVKLDLDLFPGRLFALLDMVQWNKTYGFLNCKKALVLNEDPENEYVKATAGLQMYVYQGKPPYGDLHFPVMESTPGGYDLVLFGQTLEHLYDPVLCLHNLFNAMAPGGYLFTSAPHLNHLHMHPIFFSMPTPWGLPLWADMAGFEVVKVGVFGNKQYLENIIVKFITWWPKARAYFNATRMPQIENDPAYPGQAWILVRKPLDSP